MTSIDLKDAHFLVPVDNDHQKYLKFMFGNFFQFTSVPNGYGLPMRTFANGEAKVSTQFHTKLIHISKEMRISFS